ncbi:nitrophenyl compound nitroreductase subunit ArsF family protein [Saccharicrinis sp. FJH62]|uniref:nitrophenyl compound nitroreductase subunit ArsF family protein n=1 Tax=Saccharicrinis sp. FJH62 TaxID=3344657 RepID=UPI0035D4D682
MKKTLILFCFVFVTGLVAIQAQCCSTPDPACKENAQKADQKNAESAVKAYYFHATQRCATCQAVEEVTKETLKENYGDKIPFQSINREKDKENPLIKKYQVSGTTLLIIKGDEVVNLTNDAFMNARTKPEKLKEKIKETVDAML